MDTPYELALDARCESLDAGQPYCHECGKTEREARLVWCGALACNRSICENCATDAQWEMEACSEDCETLVARAMLDRELKLRHEVSRLRMEVQRVTASVESRKAVA